MNGLRILVIAGQYIVYRPVQAGTPVYRVHATRTPAEDDLVRNLKAERQMAVYRELTGGPATRTLAVPVAKRPDAF